MVEHFLNGNALYHPALSTANAAASSCSARFVNGVCGTVGKGVNIGTRAVKRSLARSLTQNGGYQVQGVFCDPRNAVGLTPGQNAVRVATYNQAAGPYLHEAEMAGRRVHTNDRASPHRLIAGDGIGVRVTIPVATGSDFAGDDSVISCRTMLAEATGISDARVYDMVVSDRHVTTARNLADRCFGSPEKNVPAYYFAQLANKIKVDRKKSAERRYDQNPHRLTFTLDGAFQNMEYQAATQLLLCAFILDRMQTGSYKASHVVFHSRTAQFQAPSDVFWEDDEDIIFENPLDKLRDFVDAQKAILEVDPCIVPVIPASAIDGIPYEEVGITINEDELEGREATQPRPGAVVFGPNITGQLPPIDTQHEKTFVSAYSRHMCKLEKEIELPDGEVLQVVVDKNKDLTAIAKEKKYWADRLCDTHTPLYAEFLAEFPQDPDSRPNSMSEEKYNVIQAEFDTSTEWGLTKAIQASAFPKAQELTNRARSVTIPGRTSQEAAHHQCHVSAFVHSIEDFHSAKLNHTNFKGMSHTGKAKRVAMFISERGDDWVTVGFDKSANDRSVSLQDWTNMCSYFARMARVFAVVQDAGTEVPEVFSGPMKPNTRVIITTKMFTMTMDAIYYYLFSGVGPTALFNRFEVMVTVLSATCKEYGETDAELLLRWMTEPIPVQDDLTEAHDFPFVRKGYTVMKGDPSIQTPVRFVGEGDDTGLSLWVPKGNSNSQVVTAFTRTLCSFDQAWVAATVSPAHLDKHGGGRSCLEVMSSVYAIYTEHGDWYNSRISFVPKPIKRLRKLAWADINQCRTVKTPLGPVLVADENYHRVCCTKAFSLCMDLADSLFVRQVVFRTGVYHLHRLRKYTRDLHPKYPTRSMEGRGMQDAPGYIGDCLNTFYDRFQSVLFEINVESEHLLEANANAWMLETQCHRVISFRDLRALLLHLDFQASTMDITWDHIVNPDTFLACFDFKELTPFIAQQCVKSRRALEDVGGSTVPPIDVLKQGLLAASQKRLEPGPSAPRSSGVGA